MRAVILSESIKGGVLAPIPRALLPRDGKTRIEYLLNELLAIKRITHMYIYSEADQHNALLNKVISLFHNKHSDLISLISNTKNLNIELGQANNSIIFIDAGLWTSVRLEDIINYHLQSKKITSAYIQNMGEEENQMRVSLPVIVLPFQKNTFPTITPNEIQEMFSHPENIQGKTSYNAGTGTLVP